VRVGFSVDMKIGDRPVLVFGLIDSAKRIRRTPFTRVARPRLEHFFNQTLQRLDSLASRCVPV